MAEVRDGCNDGFYFGPWSSGLIHLTLCFSHQFCFSNDFSQAGSPQTIRSVKLYILTSQTGRLTFRKGVIIKFRCRNYQNFGWLAGSEHDRPNLLAVRRDFPSPEIFLSVWPKYFWLSTILPRRPVEIISRPLAGRREGSGPLSISRWQLELQLSPGQTRLFNRQSVGQFWKYLLSEIFQIFSSSTSVITRPNSWNVPSVTD